MLLLATLFVFAIQRKMSTEKVFVLMSFLAIIVLMLTLIILSNQKDREENGAHLTS